MALDKKKLVQRAKLAEKAGRYDDMANAMKSVTETGVELSNDEVNLLSVAYKNVVDARRSSWRMLSSIEQKTDGLERKQQMAREYREKVETELKEICYDVLGLLEKFLMPRALNAESQVCCLGLKGEYYQYLTEVTNGDIRYQAIEESMKAYQKAFEISKSKMAPSHTLRLGVALKLSVFYYETINSTEKACQLAKEALEEAKVQLDTLNGESCQDSSHTIQLLSDKLTLWTSDTQNDKEAEVMGSKCYATEEQIRAVFRNGVITDIILSSLSFVDLKSLRIVSQDFIEMIEKYKRFKDNRSLIIKKQAFNDINLLVESNRVWQRIKIQSTTSDVLAQVVNLLQLNRETLVDVSADFKFWEMNDLSTLHLPNLVSLSARIGKHGQMTVAQFLLNHDNLQAIEVAVREACGKEFVDVIKKCSASLKKLHLKVKKFVDLTEEREEGRDWNFLGSMTHLKDFALRRPYCTSATWEAYGNGTKLLESLPRNQLERLALTGIGARNTGFWRHENLENELALPYKLELLRGFQNLRCLSLRYSPNAVDDSIMHFIVTEMKSLEELEISHCSDLSDVGFSGNFHDGSDSIRNLKGLTKLSVRHCSEVTPEGIQNCLSLPLLRSFDYVADTRVSQSFIVGIVSQNPSLEFLAVNFSGNKADVLREVNNPRLKTLVELDDVSGSDSDSDADVLDANSYHRTQRRFPLRNRRGSRQTARTKQTARRGAPFGR